MVSYLYCWLKRPLSATNEHQSCEQYLPKNLHTTNALFSLLIYFFLLTYSQTEEQKAGNGQWKTTTENVILEEMHFETLHVSRYGWDGISY
jgi:hypothetical protein